MAASPGVAASIVSDGELTRRFTAVGESFSVNNDILGEFTRVDNVLTWGGANPEMQNTSGTPKTVTALQLWTGPVGGLLMANIPHSPVILENNETIGYALVELSFNTADL